VTNLSINAQDLETIREFILHKTPTNERNLANHGTPNLAFATIKKFMLSRNLTNSRNVTNH
jgi:hypothetical protein